MVNCVYLLLALLFLTHFALFAELPHGTKNASFSDSLSGFAKVVPGNADFDSANSITETLRTANLSDSR